MTVSLAIIRFLSGAEGFESVVPVSALATYGKTTFPTTSLT